MELWSSNEMASSFPLSNVLMNKVLHNYNKLNQVYSLYCNIAYITCMELIYK